MRCDEKELPGWVFSVSVGKERKGQGAERGRKGKMRESDNGTVIDSGILGGEGGGLGRRVGVLSVGLVGE
jgi:hypothetical protein